MEVSKDRYGPCGYHSAHRSSIGSKPLYRLRAVFAFQFRKAPQDAEYGKLQLGTIRTYRPVRSRTSIEQGGTPVRKDRRRDHSGTSRQAARHQEGERSSRLLDIRVGTVLECETVPKMKKLLKFKIADGLENRTIVSGIAQHYKPEELIGKQVLFIANLAPRQFKNGLVSEGMILSAENFDGSLAVTSVLREVKPGSEVK